MKPFYPRAHKTHSGKTKRLKTENQFTAPDLNAVFTIAEGIPSFPLTVV
jgi:hypothetical protein